MTKYYQPRKVEGGYVFGYSVDGQPQINQTGYCAMLGHVHDAPRDAIACFREFLINVAVAYNQHTEHETYCAICNKLTKQYAYVGYLLRSFALCDEHQDAASINKLLVFSGYFAVEDSHG